MPFRPSRPAALMFGALSACGLFCAPAAAAESGPLVRDGDSVAFLGDSITQQGAATPAGYVRLVASGLAANGIRITVHPAGIGGHKSNNMLERLDRDVLARKPTWMTLSCGVNDVWHGDKGVPLDAYKRDITKLVDQASAAGVKVMILTATPIQETENNFNRQLAPYNDFLRSLARERGLPLADLNARFWEELRRTDAKARPGNHRLTIDGVHMNPLGNLVMAEGVLAAFGIGPEGLERARNAWLDQPRTVELVQPRLSLREYRTLSDTAVRLGISVPELSQLLFQRALADAAAGKEMARLHFAIAKAGDFLWRDSGLFANRPTRDLKYDQDIRPLLERAAPADGWKPLEGNREWMDMGLATGRDDRGLVYARTTVTAKKEGVFLMRFAADYFGFAVVNGQVAGELDTAGRRSADAQMFPVQLRQGENTVEIRLHAGSAGNGFALGFRDDDQLLTFARPR